MHLRAGTLAVRSALALLYGYYGEHGVAMLGSRLEGIALGALAAVASAWLSGRSAPVTYHRNLLAAIPRPLRTRLDHLPALETLFQLPACAAVRDPPAAVDRAVVGALRRRVGGLRRANGAGELPEAEAWAAVAAGVAAGVDQLATPPAAASSPR